MLLVTLLAGSTAYNLPFRKPNPSIDTATYAASVTQLTYEQQVAELDRLCSSLSTHRLAMPEELQLLQQELARMKAERSFGHQQSDGGYLSSHTLNVPVPDLRALEVAEAVAEKVAEVVVAEAAVAELAAVAAARAVQAQAMSAASTAAEAAVASVAAEAKVKARAEPALPNLMQAAAEAAAAEAKVEGWACTEAEGCTLAPAAEGEAASVAQAEVVAVRREVVEHTVQVEAEVEVQVEREYGRDPRLAPQWMMENPKMLAELARLSSAQPNPTYSSASAAVSPIVSLDDLEEALRKAGEADRLVVIKFYQVRCRACLNAKAPYERAAKGPLAERADFYEVDASVARALCTLAKIEQLPVAHVYSRGQLVDTRPLHTPPVVRDFVKSLSLHADGFSS